MSFDEFNILIGGEAGQGLVTIGELLSRAMVRSGCYILVTQGYQSRIRGGHNTFSIRAGADLPLAPQDELDVLVALDPETLDLHRKDLKKDGLIIASGSVGVDADGAVLVPRDMVLSGFENTAVLGVLAFLIGIESALFEGLIRDTLGKKHPEALDENLAAFKKAYEWAKTNTSRRMDVSKTCKTDRSGRSVMLNGNQAIALGAMSAGAKFCAFYPMTPSTSVPLTLIANADAMDLVVEQAEDEIAAINMAIGASFCGAPSMVATSGGGFALMTEGISLAGMTETPVVIVVAQRPGPATGLPTRTEQADLEFVLHAGHGEFARAIFAPGSIEACFHLTHRAFHLAEASQGPVFILTDQFLADSYRAVEPFNLEGLAPVRAGARVSDIEAPYRRYLITESGVSPRLLPGFSRHLVVADSDEHTEDGHLTEDLSVREAMVKKRFRKWTVVLKEVEPPEYHGPEAPETILLTWGSSRGAGLEAGKRLRQGGESVGNLHFDQVWPLAQDQFLGRLSSAKRVVSIEGNATGQFARLIRRETGFDIKDRVLRYDGLPFTADYILERL
ncbi:2-oxoacid:acceptor oxidoreductase subunit alpha [Dissulfurimicrobium hydrothermale]|uniref:2-oxoacid:acceptor oxidoreductase subunit alpha n=1 Tax=Dissulfurimicrobium hydrothermale TaxID=1750598 RepID=UPI001EDAF4DD|nr:2-oxoacid:acceptor oxidoreductase subunit alpha [Dissulfurimicrobium hydrothermale]UKL14201.1 2-oxoacid:acceptor oxidoreductase subunit alpha [Dissulfurimicrobium hydrothermale]